MESSKEKNQRYPKYFYRKRNETDKYDGKTTVIVDGFAISRFRRVSICSGCAKTTCNKSCSKKHRYLCTSAGNWVSVQRHYKYKIFGGYRLRMYIRESIKES